jgi:hypothetical protein
MRGRDICSSDGAHTSTTPQGQGQGQEKRSEEERSELRKRRKEPVGSKDDDGGQGTL